MFQLGWPEKGVGSTHSTFLVPLTNCYGSGVERWPIVLGVDHAQSSSLMLLCAGSTSGRDHNFIPRSGQSPASLPPSPLQLFPWLGHGLLASMQATVYIAPDQFPCLQASMCGSVSLLHCSITDSQAWQTGDTCMVGPPRY